jgi:hypothetical protein
MHTIARRTAQFLALGGILALAACGDDTVTQPQPASDTAPPMAASLSTLQQTSSDVCHTIDFDEFEHGDEIETVASGFGFDLSFAVTATFGPQSSNVARAYDTDNIDGPDTDLEWQGPDARCPDCESQGRVMVLSANNFDNDGDSQDGGIIEITGFEGEGDFYVTSFVGIDHDAADDNPLELFADGTAIGITTEQGDGSVEEVTTLQTVFNTKLEFVYGGSGAVDDLVICRVQEDEPGEEGCTPGYWRNHSIYAPGNQADAWEPTGHHADDALNTVFTFPASLASIGEYSLHEALTFGGGPGAVGGARILLRAAVASLLNASHPDVEFGMTEAEVISAVNDALASEHRGTMLALAEELDDLNNQFCPLS